MTPTCIKPTIIYVGVVTYIHCTIVAVGGSNEGREHVKLSANRGGRAWEFQGRIIISPAH